VVIAKVKLSMCFFLTEHHTLKAYWWSGGIAPRILDLGSRWRWCSINVAQVELRIYSFGLSVVVTVIGSTSNGN
jgi:hypothetical protein